MLPLPNANAFFAFKEEFNPLRFEGLLQVPNSSRLGHGTPFFETGNSVPGDAGPRGELKLAHV